MNDSTFPSAAINAMKLMLFDMNALTMPSRVRGVSNQLRF
jgi:hypothetical protein